LIYTFNVLPHTFYHNYLLPYFHLKEQRFYEQICEKFKVTSLLFYNYFFRRHFTTPFCNYTGGLITQKKNKFALWSAGGDLNVFFTRPIGVLYNTDIFHFSRSAENVFLIMCTYFDKQYYIKRITKFNLLCTKEILTSHNNRNMSIIFSFLLNIRMEIGFVC
jgi:hypothetical protein